MDRKLLANGLSCVAVCFSLASAPAAAALTVYTDLSAFDAAAGPLHEIDFEAVPWNASSCGGYRDFETPIANPLTLDGITLNDLYCLRTGFCSSPTCQADPDNPYGPDAGNVVFFLNPGGSVGFPEGTPGAMLVVEGIGGNAYAVTATDYSGESRTVEAQSVYYGVAYLGFTSPHGLRRLEVVHAGGGPLVITAVLVGAASLTPEQMIDQLMGGVDSLLNQGSLTSGQGKSLKAKLSATLQQAGNGNQKTAANQLNAFINELQAHIKAGRLSSDAGQALINLASATIEKLNSGP